MTKLKTILVALMATMTMAMAGGNLTPVEEVTTVEVQPALSGFYVGAGYSYLANDLDLYGVNLSEGQNAGTILAGYNINEYVAVEGRYTFTASTDFADTVMVDGDTWGLFVKPQYNVSNDVKVYALLGYGDVKTVDDGEGFQYGLGGAFSVTRNVEVFGDWVRAYDDDITDFADATVDQFTVGVNYKF
jgi:hypothetical protein